MYVNNKNFPELLPFLLKKSFNRDHRAIIEDGGSGDCFGSYTDGVDDSGNDLLLV
jgi:hypothetical protein